LIPNIIGKKGIYNDNPIEIGTCLGANARKADIGPNLNAFFESLWIKYFIGWHVLLKPEAKTGNDHMIKGG